MRMFFLALILGAVLADLKISAQVCSSYPYVSGPSPTPSIPSKYSARVEVNMKEDEKTMEMRAFYDYSKRKAAVEIKEDKIIKKLIFNYETDEIYVLTSLPQISSSIVIPPDYQSIYPTTCETFKLSANLSLNYYFGYTGSSSFLYPGSAGQFFRFNPQAYNGTDTVRGIPCDVYISCQFNQATNANYTIKHYFSQANFTLSGGNQTFGRILVRATLDGAAIKADGSVKMFTNVYEYHDFRINLEKDDVFQTPGGVYCENRKLTNKKPPQIKGNIRFSEEITSKGATSYIKDLAYNEDLKLVRYETRNIYTNDSSEVSFSKDPFIYINDYTVGVVYKTNANTGKCSIEAIENFAFATDKNFTQAQLDSGNGYSIRIKSPSGLLELDSDYIYTGQRVIDGIQSDIYISKRNVAKGIVVYNEYAFTTENFNISNNQKPENNIPKRLAKSAQDSMFESISTIYNYDTSEPNLNQYDVTNCYEERSLIQFKLILKPKTDLYANILKNINLNKNLRTPIYLTLGNITGEASIRFSIPKLTLSDDGKLYVRSAILPGPPPLTLFTRFDSKLLTDWDYVTARNVSTAEECAIRCLQRADCLSFDFSSTFCYLNKKHFANGTTISSSTFSHYSRNSLNAVKFGDKTSIWSDLKLKLNSNTFSLYLTVRDREGNNFTLALDSQSIDEVRSNENRFGTTSLLSRYNLKKPNYKFSTNKDQLLNEMSIDDCARRCTDEIGTPCKSFHFCYLTSECVFSKDPLPTGDTNYIADTHCDVYEKDALIHYNRFQTKATINPKDKKISKIESPSDCAEKCDNELKINCKSFNYCPNSKECYLSDRHLVDGFEAGNGNLACDHYSRKYIQDFTYINTDEIKLSAEVVLKDANLDVCSTACVNSKGFDCKSFDYCPITKSCLLNSGQKPIVTNTADIAIDTCSHYRREYFFLTSLFNSKTSDGSEVVLTILSVIFAIVSCVFGTIASIYVIRKYDKKN